MTAVAQLNAALAGRYEVDREIGAGGMATVYLAKDLRHQRPVALKLLKPELGAVLGADRFLSEIRVTANLQHPNLLPLFDSGEADGLLFYVMPFVEGESLRDRLDREKQLPIEEAVRITTAIAAALDYAHRHHVIHRDLKPENILLQDGQPLIADFGIALAVSNAGGQRVTQTGLSLGTPQYMSPEQATGDRNIDGRTDIYSLGALTYEMLAGEPPHSGTTAQAIIARLMTEEPRPLSVVRRSVPAHVESAVSCALEKLPADRFSTAKEFSDAINGRAVVPTSAAQIIVARRSKVRRALPWAIAGVAAAVAAVSLPVALRPAPPPPAQVRFTIEPPPGVKIANNPPGLSIALSRDGSTLAFIAQPNEQLYLRRLDALESTLVPGATTVGDMSFSPDGKWLALKQGQSVDISRVPTDGSGARPTSLIPLRIWMGMAWLHSPTPVYAVRDTIWRIGENGKPQAIAGADKSVHRFWHSPMPLPGGRTIAVRVLSVGSVATQTGFRLGLLPTDGGRIVETDLEIANVINFIDGILLYGTRDGRVMAVRMDLEARKIIGEPVALVENVAFKGTGGVMAAVSDNGTLAYIVSAVSRRADILDDRGKVVAALPLGHDYGQPMWSPDGKRIAITTVVGIENKLWVYDVESGVLSPLTPSVPPSISTPSWSPDGRRVGFMSGGKPHWIPADGSGTSAEIPTGLPAGRNAVNVAFSPDGKYAVLRMAPTFNNATGRYENETQIYAVPLVGGGQPISVLSGPMSVGFVRLSPNGKWLGYSARIDGQREVELFVTTFPNPGPRTQVTAAGGVEPEWSRDSKRLVYRTETAFRAARFDITGAMPRLVGTDSIFAAPWVGGTMTAYDISPDGRRFIASRDVGEGSRIIVVTNWLDDVRANRLKDVKGRSPAAR